MDPPNLGREMLERHAVSRDEDEVGAPCRELAGILGAEPRARAGDQRRLRHGLAGAQGATRPFPLNDACVKGMSSVQMCSI